MNKKTKMILSAIIILIIFFISIQCILLLIKSNKNDLSKYERIDKNDYQYINYYKDFEKLKKDVEKGTHYIYFGKPSCQWCQQYISYYVEYAQKYNKKILYFNPDTVKGTIETINEDGSISLKLNDKYQNIINWIEESDKELEKGYLQYNLFVKDSKGNNHTKLWLYVPKLFKVVDGKIIDMVSDVEGHLKIQDKTGKTYLPEMTIEQIDILKKNLERIYTN